MVAHLHNARGEIVRQIVRCKRYWVDNRVIPETQAGKKKHIFSGIKEEELITDVRTYIKVQGDSMDKQST